MGQRHGCHLLRGGKGSQYQVGAGDSHDFPMVGMVIKLIVGVYIPIIRIPYIALTSC